MAAPPELGPPRRRTDRRPAVAVTLVVLGLAFWALFRLTVGSEQHAYVPNASPPAGARLTAGDTYSISVPGGVDTVRRQGGSLDVLACSIDYGRGASRAISVTPESDSSRALDQIATFIAPETGRASVRCADLSRVFVDDADDSATDWSGVLLVLAIISLTVGVPLLLSALRGTRPPAAA